ncbi:MAG TPA: TRAP transporter small permease [Burkholderiales bacterium]|nr:TRAP transporter small permease [Burkholderiales bacterium]
MTLIRKAYHAILYGMAWLAGVLMVATMAMIVLDVALRNLGFQSSAHFFTFTEYFLLLIPLLGAPWLVREKGHIYIELLVTALPARAQRALLVVIVVACIAVASILAWYGGLITVQDFLGNEKDVRSFDMPRWMLMAFMPLSFGMMAIEFLRLLLRGESPYGSGLIQGD